MSQIRKHPISPHANVDCSSVWETHAPKLEQVDYFGLFDSWGFNFWFVKSNVFFTGAN